MSTKLFFLLPLLSVIVWLKPAIAGPRVWVDADPACGQGATFDPDDCLALLHLLTADNIDVIGVSSVFGNDDVQATTSIARSVLARVHSLLTVSIGAAGPIGVWRSAGSSGADDIVVALRTGNFVFVALGPLTNLAVVLQEHPELAPRVTRVVAVMGKRPGEIFHPAEGSSRALLGHGPIFSDMNFVKDPLAAQTVLESGVPVTLVPYAAGKTQSITPSDIVTLSRLGGAPAWVAHGSREWLAFWRDYVGRDEFYPFDLVASVAVTHPEVMRCRPSRVEVRPDERIGWFGFGPVSLLFSASRLRKGFPVELCDGMSGRAFDLLMDGFETRQRHG